MKKTIVFCSGILFFFSSVNAQYSNWEPSEVYAIDRVVINEIRSNTSNANSAKKLAENEFDEINKKLKKSIAENMPAFARLDTMLGSRVISFTGISYPDFGSTIESVLTKLKSFDYKQYLQKEFRREDALIQQFKGKITEFVNGSALPASVKTEVNKRISSVQNELLFQIDQNISNAIEKVSPLVSDYLIKRIGSDNWNQLKTRLAADAEKIMEIPQRLNNELTSYLQPRLKAFADIKYFSDQIVEIQKVYEETKRNNPAEAFKLMQKSKLYQDLIESADLKNVNNYALKILNVSDDINKVQKLLSGNDNIMTKALGTFTILEKNIRESGLFPEYSAEFNKVMGSISNSKEIAKANLYVSMGSAIINNKGVQELLHMSSNDVKNANLLLGTGMAVFSFYTGNIVGGITSTLGVLEGLFGGGGGDDAMANGLMNLQNIMVDGFSQVFKGMESMNQNLGIISKQINQNLEATLEGRKEAAKYFELLSQQNKAIMEGLQAVSGQVRSLHEDLIRSSEQIMLKLNTMDEKLDRIYQLGGCVLGAIQEAALIELNSCKGVIELIKKKNPESIADYNAIYSGSVQECYKAFMTFTNSLNPATKLIDYSMCADNLKGTDSKNDPALIYGELRKKWGSIFNNQGSYLALVNPSVNVDDDIILPLEIEKKNKLESYLSGSTGMYKNLFDSPDDKLNNSKSVIEIAEWYLQMMPFRAVIDWATRQKKQGALLGNNISDNEVIEIEQQLEFLRKILQITIAQQSILSGTMLLNQLQNKLINDAPGSFEGKKEVLELMKSDYLLAINLSKFLCTMPDWVSGPRGKMFTNGSIRIAKLENNTDEPLFYIRVFDKLKYLEEEKLVDNPVSESDRKEVLKKLKESLVRDALVFIIDDLNTVRNLDSKERVLPPGFSRLLELHNTYSNLLAEIGAMKTLSPDDLKKLKSVYLN